MLFSRHRMCCCCRKKKSLDVKFSGRHCTDPICLVLFGVAWFISIVILLSARRTADVASWIMASVLIRSLSFGRDYNGNVCGRDINPPGAEILGCPSGACTQVYYPRLMEDVSISLAFVAPARCVYRRTRRSPCLVSVFRTVRLRATWCARTTTRYSSLLLLTLGCQLHPSLRGRDSMHERGLPSHAQCALHQLLGRAAEHDERHVRLPPLRHS